MYFQINEANLIVKEMNKSIKFEVKLSAAKRTDSLNTTSSGAPHLTRDISMKPTSEAEPEVIKLSKVCLCD